MTNRLTQAQEEAYAAAPVAVVIIHTIQLAHPSWAQSVYLATGVEADIVLADENGVSRTFTACAFDVTPPSTGEGGPGDGRIAVDNVSGLLRPYLALAQESGLEIAVTYRAYRSDMPSSAGDVITGLVLKAVTLTATRAEGAIGHAEIGAQACPRQVFDQPRFPGIWAVGGA